MRVLVTGASGLLGFHLAVPQQEQEPHEQEPATAPDADELAGPDAPGRDRRLSWAELMRRAYACDVLRWPRCGGDMRLIAVVQDAAGCERILRHVGVWTRGPPRGRRVVLDARARA